MARRRSFMPRPIEHLTRALASHEALSGHADDAQATDAAGEVTGLSTESAAPRRRQKRDRTGRFDK